MTEAYHGRADARKAPSRTEKNRPHSEKLVHLLIKQTAAALLFALTAIGMKTIPLPRINQYAAALGCALRCESDLSAAETLKSNILSFFHDWLQKNTTPKPPTDGTAEGDAAAIGSMTNQ